MPGEGSIFEGFEERRVGGNVYLSRHLDSTGDGTGTKDMATTADSYYLTPASNERFVVHNLIIHYKDTGTMDTNAYGNALTLSSGILLDVTNSADASIFDLLDGEPVTTNPEWTKFAAGSAGFQHSVIGSGPELISVNFNFELLFGIALTIDGHLGESLRMTIQDDMSNLDEHEALATGHIFIL